MTMNKQTEARPSAQAALKMAIEALESAYSSHGKILPSYPAQDAWMFHGCDEKLSKALQACKDALAQPAQEPVAVIEVTNHHGEYKTARVILLDKGVGLPHDTFLYTHPAPSWQGLSDDEINDIVNKIRDDMYPWKDGMLVGKVARAIEQALKEKNT